MQTITTATDNYIDIIYNNRNKSYGGYELRQHYQQRATIGATVTIASVVAVFFVQMLLPNMPEHLLIASSKPVEIIDVVLPPRKELKVLPPEPPKLPPAAPKATSKFTEFVISKQVNDEELAKTVAEIKQSTSGAGNSDEDSVGDGPIGSTSGTGKEPTIVQQPQPRIAVVVDQMPSFNGDIAAYLSQHITYPERARASGLEGRVMVSFVVNEDGSISNVTLGRGIGGGCDEEAMRVIAAMPKWKPGKNNGIPVKVYYTQPISFKMY